MRGALLYMDTYFYIGVCFRYSYKDLFRSMKLMLRQAAAIASEEGLLHNILIKS